MQNFILLLSLVWALMLAQPQTAQAQKQPTHNWELRAGAGLLPTFNRDQVNTELLPLLAEFRARINPRFSVGLLGGHSISNAQRYDVAAGETRTIRNAFTVVGLRGAVHTSAHPRWEAYGGMTIGYGFNKLSNNGLPPDDVSPRDQLTPRGAVARNGIFLSAFIGGQYQVTPHLAAFSELGFGISILTTGVSYRFSL